MDLNFILQAVISMVVITAPPDPSKVVFFNTTITLLGKKRTPAALFVAGVVLAILVGSALVGREFLELLGINMHAFSVVGGLVIAAMGFEMLYGGAPSKAQGGKTLEEGPQDNSGLILPLATPLIAGPGAIVTIITISSAQNNPDALIAALLGAATVAILVFVSFEWFGGAISKLSPRATALLVRIGGLLLATIGTQMLLGGLKNFFAS